MNSSSRLRRATRRVLLLVVAVGCAAAVAPATAGAQDAPTSDPSQLRAGQSLEVGQSLVTPHGGYRLVMQADGNLVEYVTTAEKVAFATGTFCATTSRLTMQTDGNAVLYCGTEPVFATHTEGTGGTIFWLGSYGDISVRNSFLTTIMWNTPEYNHGMAPFASYTSDSGVYQFVMQTDGNLVLYSNRGGSHALWSSRTAGHRGSIAGLLGDGTLAIYQTPTSRIWYSGQKTGFLDAQTIRVQDDGNVVLIAYLYQSPLNPNPPPEYPVWSTGTAGRA